MGECRREHRSVSRYACGCAVRAGIADNGRLQTGTRSAEDCVVGGDSIIRHYGRDDYRRVHDVAQCGVSGYAAPLNPPAIDNRRTSGAAGYRAIEQMRAFILSAERTSVHVPFARIGVIRAGPAQGEALHGEFRAHAADGPDDAGSRSARHRIDGTRNEALSSSGTAEEHIFIGCDINSVCERMGGSVNLAALVVVAFRCEDDRVRAGCTLV